MPPALICSFICSNQKFCVETKRFHLRCTPQILNSDHSTSFWLSVQLQHSLPPSCIARYVPDSSLLTYDAPPSARPRSPLASTMRSISPPTTPTPTSRTNKGNKAWTTGGTEPIHPDDIIKEVWYDEVDPRMVKHEKFPAAGQHIAKAAPKSKARAAAKPIPKAAPKSKAKAAPKATEHGAGEAKPKRKRASGAGGARVKKTKKGESGEV